MHHKHDTEAQQWAHEDVDHVVEQFLTIKGQLKYIAMVAVCGSIVGSIIYGWMV